MRIENYIDLEGRRGASGLFFAAGSFGVIDGDVEYVRTDRDGVTEFTYTTDELCLRASFTREENGVIIRRDTLKSLTDKELEVNSLLSRFLLPGDIYEVYTQYSAWQHESNGSWQPLVTQITAAAQGMRTCDGAAPIMAFHECYSGKNTVFHLIPNAQWQMTARKFPRNDRERVVLETGFYDQALHLCVKPGETIELPTLICFHAESKTDLDAWRLHEVYNRLYPRRTLPVIYNSWLYSFSHLDIDKLLKQVDCAAEMGFEGFMIDAGWFGDGADWSGSVGDWEENMTAGPCGRLAELSARVREKGMIFGLWFEPERTAPTSRAIAEHPDYYFDQTFLDFANPEAVDYMTDVISAQIEKYHIGWVKFDCNSSTTIDLTGNAFYRYLQGQRRFLEQLKKRYPDLYITNCAGGGFRMEMSYGATCDSFWLSDNQGPYEGIRIVKDTLKRMPTGLIERWNCQHYCESLPAYGKTAGRMINCNDATWEFLIGVQDSFSEAFMHGGPLGFSCDLTSFSDEYRQRWSDVIAQYKKDRDFYKNANARILVDSDSVIVIQYSDRSLSRCILQVFTKCTHAFDLMVYPVLDKTATYRKDEALLSGKTLSEDGILLHRPKLNSCQVIELNKQ